MIDWSKLEPYQNNKYRSFEELCYQIAKVLYAQEGQFTSIDDSGGGDGVEFYLTLPNGVQWGWQAKFYFPEPRLNASNRKQSIQSSLEKACLEHPGLKKWFLCTPTNFTPGATGEQSWFDNILPQSVPKNMTVEIIHWSDSDFNDWFSKPAFSGKRNYFFGELELTFDWFRTQFEKQKEAIRDKFNPDLHIETYVDFRIHALLGDTNFNSYFEGQLAYLKELLVKSNLDNFDLNSVGQDNAKVNLFVTAKTVQKALTEAIKQLSDVHEFVIQLQLDELKRLDLVGLQTQINQAYETHQEAILEYDASRNLRRPVLIAPELIGGVLRLLFQLSFITQIDLHILGNAGIGKTHVATHICYERLNAGLPALLVLGRHFTSDQSLEEQLRGILDIPPKYSWNDFLQALASAAEAYHTRIPLVIDGLNEATRNGIFSDVWEVNLPGFVREIAQTSYILLITTCRSTYKEAIWHDDTPQNLIYARGFIAEDDLETAINKYFTWYKIKTNLTASSLSQFEHPIYLRIFCESKNPTRQKEMYIDVSEQTLFEVFDNYLSHCDRVICNRLRLRHTTPIVTVALNKMAEYLWQYHTNSITLRELVKIIDGKPLDGLEWFSSRTQAIESEGLLIIRDLLRNEESVFFTYDLLGGYLIALYLIDQAADNIEDRQVSAWKFLKKVVSILDPGLVIGSHVQKLLGRFQGKIPATISNQKLPLESLLKPEDLKANLFGNNYQALHPLHTDIRRCLAALLPIRTRQYLHNLIDDEVAFRISIEALFEIAPENVDEDCVNLVAQLFTHARNRQKLLDLAILTLSNIRHPLNILFWSAQLKLLSMSERDISWTEHLRSNAEHFEKTLTQLERGCRSTMSVSEITETGLHLLAKQAMWQLTSTVRSLRDKATRALYWYGRRFPQQFLELVLSSLEINDPYVPERMLAANYGVAMARQYDFKDSIFTKTILPIYGRKLYEAIFKPNAPFSTTHILARDYAKRTIDIALIHHPTLLTVEEKQRVIPPFTDGGIRLWGKSEDKNEDEYRDGNAPIQMDFAHYTLDGLVRDGENDDLQPNENETVRENIFWRIYNLGYSLDVFGEIDKWIARANWQYSRSADGSKTDRYGKKYSWIAFYELAGLRQDKNLLRDSYHEGRISDADIDPSFPEKLQEYNLIQDDFLGDRNLDVEEWVLQDGSPHVTPYLVVDELCGESGPWVLLNGSIDQKEQETNREISTFLLSLIVQAGDADIILKGLRQSHPGRMWIPEIPKDFYTYAGEIPWCDTYPANGWDELSLVISTKSVQTPTKRLVSVGNGERVPLDEADQTFEYLVRKADENVIKDVIEQELRTKLQNPDLKLEIEIVETEQQVEERQTFQVLTPVKESNWENYHSVVNTGRNWTTPAKELTEYFDLCSQPQTFDLFEKNGKRASVTFQSEEGYHLNQSLTYLRQDLLERFLSETNAALIWVIEGKRGFYDLETHRAFVKNHELDEMAFTEVMTYQSFKKE